MAAPPRARRLRALRRPRRAGPGRRHLADRLRRAQAGLTSGALQSVAWRVAARPRGVDNACGGSPQELSGVCPGWWRLW